MMIIKGRRAQVQNGNGRAASNQHGRPEVQKHWPGLLPSAYPDPTLVYGTNQRPLIATQGQGDQGIKMPQIVARKPQTAKAPYMMEDSSYQSMSMNNRNVNLDQYTGKMLESYISGGALQTSNAGQRPDEGGNLGTGGLQQLSSQEHAGGYGVSTAGGQPMTSMQPSFQTTSMPTVGALQATQGPQGIGPGGMELTSFFLAQSQQMPNNIQNSPRKTAGPSTVGGINTSVGMNSQGKQESEVNIQNYSIEQQNLSKSQNLYHSTGNIGPGLGSVAAGPHEFSPENTQFTILKAKLFNPQINQANQQAALIGGNSFTGPQHLKEENSQSTFHQSVLGGPNAPHGMNNSLIKSSGVSAYLNHQRIDEHHTQIVQNFQQQYLMNQNSSQMMPSLLGYKSLHQNGNPVGGARQSLPELVKPQKAGQKGMQANNQTGKTERILSHNPYSAFTGSNQNHPSTANSGVQRSMDLGRQLKHKKDMQQLKFYQTLTSQAHLYQQQVPQSQISQNRPGVVNRQISVTGGASQLNPNSMVNSQNLLHNSGPQIIIPYNGNVAQNAAGSMLSQQGPTTINVSSTRTNNPQLLFTNDSAQNKQGQQSITQTTTQKASPQRAKGAEQSDLTNKSAIVVKDGENHSGGGGLLGPGNTGSQSQINIKSPKFRSSFHPNQIQTGSQSLQSVNEQAINNRPLTSVNLDEQLLEEGESIPDNDEIAKQASKTQRDFSKKLSKNFETRHGLGSQNDKSYTQNISEASREDNMILKPQNILNDIKGSLDQGIPGRQAAGGGYIGGETSVMDSASNILSMPLNPKNMTQLRASSVTPGNAVDSLVQIDSLPENQPIAPQKNLTTHTMRNDQLPEDTQVNKSQVEGQSSSAVAYGLNNVSSNSGNGNNNRRRQLLSIDSNNPQKKKGFNETGDFGAQMDSQKIEQAVPYTVSNTVTNMTAQGFSGIGGQGTLNASVNDQYSPKMEKMMKSQNQTASMTGVSNTNAREVELKSSQLILIQKNQQQLIHLKSSQLPPQIVDPHRLQTAASVDIKPVTSGPEVVRNNLIIKKCEIAQRANLLVQQAGKDDITETMKKKDTSNALFPVDSKTNQRQAQTAAIQNQQRMQHSKHSACQRFLDRGNKPVPPNYEEQDVVPPYVQDQSQQQYLNKIKSLYQSQPSRQQDVTGLNQPQMIKSGEGQPRPAKLHGKVNLDDFDEEINGINLSKLFSAYGPSSLVEKDATLRKNRTQAGPRFGAGTSSSPQNASLRKSLPDSLPRLKGHANTEEFTDEDYDEGEEDPDFSGFDEPVVIRLMANMFSQKKIVQEILPEISLEKLQKELYEMRLQQKAKLEKEKRDQNQWEWLKKAEFFLKKFSRYLNKQSQYSEDQNQLAIAELRQNPFYIALKENTVERDRLRKIKELQMIEYVDERQRQEQEEELKKRAHEQVKTDIFKHTFVDAEQPSGAEEVIYPTQESTDIMNRPPKDVFTFMNLNFDLPAAYYQTFGDFNAPTEHQRSLIRDFMLSHWPQMKNKRLTFRIAYDATKCVFNVILLGKNCPLSKCCKMTVCFQFDREIGGKVICMETLCPYNPLDQFFMPSMDLIEELFRGSNSTQLQADPLNQTGGGGSTISDQAFAPSSQHPKLRKVMAMEVSKTISKGLHKNGGSIRDMLLKSSAVNNTFNELQMKQRNDMIAQLYSSEGALQVLHNQMQLNHPMAQLKSNENFLRHHPLDDPIQEEGTIEDEHNLSLSKRQRIEQEYQEFTQNNLDQDEDDTNDLQIAEYALETSEQQPRQKSPLGNQLLASAIAA